MERTKECTKCGVEKPLSAFSKHRLSKDGHAYQCKECNSTRAKAWRGTPIGIYTNIKGRANYLNKKKPARFKPVLVTQDEFVEWYTKQDRICAYCSILEDDLWILREHFDNRVYRLTVDNKDNKLGYSLENMVLACERCNFIKGNLFSFEQMREIGQKYVRPIWEEIKYRKASEENGKD